MNRVYLLPSIALLAALGAGRAQAAPSLTLTPVSLSFQYQIGGTIPAAQKLALKSTGTALAFTVTVNQPAACTAPCLTVSASSGTTPATLEVYANPTGLAAGTYATALTILASGAATTSQNVTVLLTVGDAPSTLSASTGEVDFSYTTGIPPIVQSMPVTLSTSGDPLTAAVTVAGGTWLSASPAGTIAQIGLPQTLTISADATGLAPAATPYKGTVTITSSNATDKSVVIIVTLTVTSGVPTISYTNGIWPPGAPAGSTTPVTVTITGSNFSSASTAISGMNALTTPLTSITVINSTTMLATIPVSLLATTGSLPIVIVTPTAATQSAPGSFTVYDPTVPQVWAVVNSASYNPGVVSPGEIVTIYGSGLGPAGLTQFSGSSLPASLGVGGYNTSVLIDGKIAPLLYTSPTQVSCIVPLSVAPGTASGSTVNLVVTFNGVPSAVPFKVTVAATDPGIFTLNAAGQAALLNIDTSVTPIDYSVNSVKNPAAAGTWVAIYATGFGATTCTSTPTSQCASPPTQESQFVSGGTVTPVGAVAVNIGGLPVTSPVAVVPVGSVVGLLQINAQLPVTLTTGTAVPIVITIGGVASAGTATMVVK
jgi:uncharacterized protein (TIGR03437 family)